MYKLIGSKHITFLSPLNLNQKFITCLLFNCYKVETPQQPTTFNVYLFVLTCLPM